MPDEQIPWQPEEKKETVKDLLDRHMGKTQDNAGWMLGDEASQSNGLDLRGKPVLRGGAERVAEIVDDVLEHDPETEVPPD